MFRLIAVFVAFVATVGAARGARGDAGSSDAPREIASWLGGLVSGDGSARADAVRAIEQASPAMLPAIAERLAVLGRSSDRTAMGAVVAEIVKPRAVPRDEIAGRLPDGGFSQADDWFVLIMRSPAPERAAWRDLASILGLSRLLAKIGTTPAVRELTALFPAYGDLLRADLERQLVVMGERALPALIEMRRAEVRESRVFALKVLEALGKAIPGEAVQMSDDQLLVEVLLAYGRARDADAARTVLSFANSDRRMIRDAARQAMMTMGEVGRPALRESYENMMSQRAPETWGAETTARELFLVFDRARLAEAHTLMEEGLAAFAQKDAERAASAFDRALSRDATFVRRAEMAPAYLAYGRAQMAHDRGRALAALRQAIRVDPQGPLARAAESEVLLLEARGRADHGVTDESALRRALELDPDNADVKAEIARIGAESEARSRRFSSYFYGALAALAVVAGLAGAIAYGRRSRG